jgi:hypothetical protein
MRIDSPGHCTELTDTATQVVEDVQGPAVNSHGIVHVMHHVFKQQLVLLNEAIESGVKTMARRCSSGTDRRYTTYSQISKGITLSTSKSGFHGV